MPARAARPELIQDAGAKSCGTARRAARTPSSDGYRRHSWVLGSGGGRLSRVALGAHAQLAAQADRELGRRLVVAVEAGALVAHDAALAQLDHAPAHLVDHHVVVGGDDHGRARAVDAVDQLHDPDRGLGIEVARRLVGQQQRRVVHERPRDRDALLLAAGQLGRQVVELGRQADHAQDVRHLAADLLAALADHLKRVGDVVVDRAVRQQLVVLEDRADVAAQVGHARARDVVELLARDRDLALRGLELLHEQPDAGRLAAAGGADEEDELPAPDPQRRALEAHRAAVVDLRHVVELHDGDVAPGRARTCAIGLRLRLSGSHQAAH